MKKTNFFRLLPAIVSVMMMVSCNQPQSNNTLRISSFDSGWRFIKENPAGAENPAFDDSQWRTIDLPHDWSIEDLPGQIEDSIIGPFSKASIGKMGTGYTIGGTAWYRKSFTIDKADKNKIAYLQFDGVYMNSDIWVNGKHVGNHTHGYTSFYYDITQYLNPAGQPNTVAVQVKNEGKTARWYSGSGIYRHTWLTLVNTTHIGMWGVYAKTPVVSEKSAEIEITATLENKGKDEEPVIMNIQITDRLGNIVVKSDNDVSLKPDSKSDITQKLTVENPALWSVENPALYQAKVTLLKNNKEADNTTITFGIRSIHFDAQTGFTLNGKSVELKGGCFHHDNGPLGSAAIDRAEERKIELLKSAGYNAIRCSHNPPSPYLLSVCDRLGMFVIDEIFDMWEKTKVSPDDYSKFFKNNWKQDVQSMVVRDRNHPSVIMWSIGNEIPEAADTSGLRIGTNIAAEVRKFDQTRAVTEAMVDFGAFMSGISGWDKQAPHMDQLDVVGYNYFFAKYEGDHEKYPNRVMMATEFMPPLSFENFRLSEKLPYVIGNFSWTAMDYLGEAGVGLARLVPDVAVKSKPGTNDMSPMMAFFGQDSWPVFNDYQGDIDLIGTPKAPSFYQNVVWRNSKIEVLVHRPVPQGMKEIVSPWGFPDELKSWNWAGHEGEKIQVHVYTRSQIVKLELNGKIIGEQKVDDSKSITATFQVPYEAGTLTAHCYDNGTETASQTIKTTGKPSAIRLTADRSTIKADRNDLSYIKTEIVDAEGNVVPCADEIEVIYEITGNGEIAGTGSGNPQKMASFKQPRNYTFHGICLAILRPSGPAGKIILKARSEGLKQAAIEVTTE